ncbi:MAG: [LysW]-lysine hydrolase [Anaerolineae bacterium]|nr:[LysW]-lysine hydrolase [Anaerolineae bacterium]
MPIPAETLTPDEAVDLLERLVSIPSLSGEEAEASACLVEWMSTHGFEARVDEAGSAVGSRGNGPNEILLLGHIDTFPGSPLVVRDGDWLAGRGTVDAKGPLCAFAAAAVAVDVPQGWKVTVAGAVEEEAATSKGARHILANAPRPTMCVIGEPSDWNRITLGYKGRLLCDVLLRAPFAHTAGQAALPAEQAVGLWENIRRRCETINTVREKAFDRLDPSLRHICSQDDGAYGIVDLSIGFRLPPDLSPDDLKQQFEEWIEPVSKETAVEVTFSGSEVVYRGDKNNALVRAFLTAIRAQGERPRFVVKTGTSDMNVVGPVWNCPIVAYGPGDSSLDHTPGERINLTDYLKAIEVLKAMLKQVFESTESLS